MLDLLRQFQLLESRLAAGDMPGAARAAGDLRTLTLRPSYPRERVDAERMDVFEEHIERLAEVALDVAELAGADDERRSAQAFQALRATCVSCHFRFRGDNEERGTYPARGNTVTGMVELVDADGKPLADRSWVLVFLEGGPAHAPEPPYENPRILQSGRKFSPRVLPVTVGTDVEFPNDDTIFHNVFSLSKTSPFDLGVYEPGQSASVRMERSGLVKVYCNIHPDMCASIVVLENPWYSLTDRGGRFVICNVPDGEYILRGWNDKGAEASVPLVVSGEHAIETSLSLAETRRSLTHTNKFGKPYAEKYR